MRGSTARVTLKAVVTLRAKWRCHSASVIFSILELLKLRALLDHAGIVHDNVDAAEFCLHCVDQFADIFNDGQVGGECGMASAEGFEALEDAFCGRGDGHPRPCRGKRPGCCKTDTFSTSSTCYQRHTIQNPCHDIPLKSASGTLILAIRLRCQMGRSILEAALARAKVR